MGKVALLQIENLEFNPKKTIIEDESYVTFKVSMTALTCHLHEPLVHLWSHHFRTSSEGAVYRRRSRRKGGSLEGGRENNREANSEGSAVRGLEDSPEAGLEDSQEAGMNESPEADGPKVGLEDGPEAELEDDPEAGLEDDPEAGLEETRLEDGLHMTDGLEGLAGSQKRTPSSEDIW
jgi:hypothetical protein